MDRTIAAGYVLNQVGHRVYADFVPGTPGQGGQVGTSLSAFDRTQVQEEIVTCIEESGQTPSNQNTSQLWAAIQAAVSGAVGGSAGSQQQAWTQAIASAIAGVNAEINGIDASINGIDTSLASMQAALAGDFFFSMGTIGTNTINVPSWAKSIEVIAIGPGGNGASCQSGSSTPANTNASGAGGGAGGLVRGLYGLEGQSSFQIVVGQGGSGTATQVIINGQTAVSAGAGGNAAFTSTAVSAGGGGGITTGGTVLNLQGGSGSDGQNGNFIFAGNGASSAFGGGGRAGAQGGINATSWGAGGGGAYDANAKNTAFSGGTGGQGGCLFRFVA